MGSLLVQADQAGLSLAWGRVALTLQLGWVQGLWVLLLEVLQQQQVGPLWEGCWGLPGLEQLALPVQLQPGERCQCSVGFVQLALLVGGQPVGLEAWA